MAENFYPEACELMPTIFEHLNSLRENEREFVEDLHTKLEQYHERTYISDKQMNWLRAIAARFYRDPRQTSFL